MAFADQSATARLSGSARPPERALRLLLALLTVLPVGLPALLTVPTQAAGPEFVAVQGDGFVLRGERVVVKGSNYYQRNAPWGEMWRHWYGPQVEQEIAEGTAKLGLNSLRVLVPYGSRHGWTDEAGAVNPVYLNELQQLVQIAGNHQLRVIITLFDFADDWPAAGTAAEAAHRRYLETIVGAFRDDDRVLAWDLHNEPDFYATWRRRGRPAVVVDWLTRMAAATRRLDPNHLVTVGLGDYQNYWFTAAPDLPRVLDLVDFVSHHAYDATDFAGQVREIKAHTGKPIVFEEVGWPTGPSFVNDGYTEAVQLLVYEQLVQVMQAERLAGATQWLMWDLSLGRQARVTHDADWMGLLRRDGSLKPAGAVYAAWAAPPLPAGATSSLPLTGAPLPEADRPLAFAETNLEVAAPFKQRWLDGGLAVFGLPLTPPLNDDGRTVQFFERAVMEIHPEARAEPGYADLPPAEQVRRVVPLRLLGRTLTAGRAFAPVAPFPSGEGRVYFAETGHSLAGGFKHYWDAHGGLAQFGYPISEEVAEPSSADGVARVVQYFERARFEYHPEHAGTPYEVLLGDLGREELRRRGWLHGISSGL